MSPCSTGNKGGKKLYNQEWGLCHNTIKNRCLEEEDMMNMINIAVSGLECVGATTSKPKRRVVKNK